MALANELAKKFLMQIENLRKEKGEDLTIGDVDGLFKHLRSEQREELYKGVQDIANKINTVKVEISETHPESLSGNIIPDANVQLDAVVQATENATNKILDSVEVIQNAISGIEGKAADIIMEEVTKIFEASNFQDITGQRIRKVVKAMMDIEASVNHLLIAMEGKVHIEARAKPKEVSADKALMSGPQIDTPSQDDIDKLFADS